MPAFIMDRLREFLFLIPCILISLPVHEVAHGYAAYRLGDPTARNFGRLSLNPLKHFDPLGVICMLLFRFGWARPVPVNTRHFKKPRRDMALVALAGPVSNLLLGFIALLFYRILWAIFAANIGAADPAAFTTSLFATLMEFISIFFSINISLAVFNLLPIPPLDGSRLLMLFLPPKAHMWVVQHERYITVVIFLLLMTGIFRPVLNLLYNLIVNGMTFLINLIPFL